MSSSTYDSDTDVKWNYKLLENRYIIVDYINAGGCSTVWMAYDIYEKQFVAIKIAHRNNYDCAFDELEKYETINKFSHTNNLLLCLKSFEIDTDEGIYLCQIFPLMGGTLYDIIKNKLNLSPNIIKSIIHQCVLGLNELHRHKLYHGDIKPENILFTEYNSQQKKIMDELKFLSKISFNKHNKTQIVESMIEKIKERMERIEYDNKEFNFNENIVIKIGDLGSCVNIETEENNIDTIYYNSPEIILGFPQTLSSDIWALGCTLFELFTYEVLFDPHTEQDNHKRFHLYLITSFFGNLPEDIIKKSSKKDLFFTSDLKCIKGYSSIEEFSAIDVLQDKINKIDLNDNDKKNIISCITNMLVLDYNNRISSRKILDTYKFI